MYVYVLCMYYRVIRKSLCTWRTIVTQLMIWRWPSQNTFGMWTVLYRTRSSRTQFGVSINVWRLAGDILNITCNFLYCNNQVNRYFFVILYVRICVYVFMCMCVCVRPLYFGCSDISIDLFLASIRIVFWRLNSSDLHLNIQSVPRSKHFPRL